MRRPLLDSTAETEQDRTSSIEGSTRFSLRFYIPI